MRKYIVPIVFAIGLAVAYYFSYQHVKKHEADLTPAQQVMMKQVLEEEAKRHDKVETELKAQQEKIVKELKDQQDRLERDLKAWKEEVRERLPARKKNP
jgi:uncharacterized protein HemX